MNDSLTLTAARVVTPGGILEAGWVEVSGSLIVGVGSGDPGPTPADTVHFGGGWIVPGFVDLHCHGGGGGAFGAELDQAHTAITTHLAHGTTTMLASLVSAPLDELSEQVSVLSELVRYGQLAGIHLEGPFLSVDRRGSHDPAVLRDPEPGTVRQLLGAGQGTVRMVTLAPERDHAPSAIRLLVDAGVIAAIGHTDASFDQTVAAVEAGATVATHLFNGMRPLHHREPGPIGALLQDERISVELICDLVHVHPGAVKLATTHAGSARTLLVTDAISATETGDGSYELGSLPVTVSNGEPRLADGSLAGSTLTMDVAFRNLVACGLSIPDAVAAAATVPASLLGMSDRVGAIKPGLAADLVVLDDDLQLRSVMKGGTWMSIS